MEVKREVKNDSMQRTRKKKEEVSIQRKLDNQGEHILSLMRHLIYEKRIKIPINYSKEKIYYRTEGNERK